MGSVSISPRFALSSLESICNRLESYTEHPNSRESVERLYAFYEKVVKPKVRPLRKSCAEIGAYMKRVKELYGELQK